MIGNVRWRFGEVKSTQDVAFHLAELGAPHGTVVRADYQSAGRGRQGKTWESARRTALMFSILLRPKLPLHELGCISILVAVALADVFREHVSAAVQIKWPNDVMIDGRKASGILVQTRSGQEPVAVLGIGINVDLPVESLPDGVTYLNRHALGMIDVEALYASILHRLDTVWESFQPELAADQIQHLESRLWQHGEMVSIIDADREVYGRLLGLAKNGGLRLSIEGLERVVVAGELVRGPRPIKPTRVI